MPLDEAGGADDWYNLLVNRPTAVIVSLCVVAVVIFVVVFGVLQFTSRKQRGSRIYRDYQMVASSEMPSVRCESNFERVSLTSDEMEEENSLFEKT